MSLASKLADDALHRPVVEQDDVVEDEHVAAHFVGQLESCSESAVRIWRSFVRPTWLRPGPAV